MLAAHQVLSALALVSLDHSGSQACIRQPGQPCRRGVAVQLPASPTATTPALTTLMAALAAPTAGGSAAPLVQATAVGDFTAVVDPSSASDRTTSNGTNTLRHLDTRPVPGLGDYPAHFRTTTADIASFQTVVAGPGGRTVAPVPAAEPLAPGPGAGRATRTRAGHSTWPPPGNSWRWRRGRTSCPWLRPTAG